MTKTSISTSLLFRAFRTEIIKNINEEDRRLEGITLLGIKKNLTLHGKTLTNDFKIDLSTPNEQLLLYGFPKDLQFKRIKKLAVEIMGGDCDISFSASTNGDRYYQWKR